MGRAPPRRTVVVVVAREAHVLYESEGRPGEEYVGAMRYVRRGGPRRDHRAAPRRSERGARRSPRVGSCSSSRTTAASPTGPTSTSSVVAAIEGHEIERATEQPATLGPGRMSGTGRRRHPHGRGDAHAGVRMRAPRLALLRASCSSTWRPMSRRSGPVWAVLGTARVRVVRRRVPVAAAGRRAPHGARGGCARTRRALPDDRRRRRRARRVARVPRPPRAGARGGARRAPAAAADERGRSLRVARRPASPSSPSASGCRCGCSRSARARR